MWFSYILQEFFRKLKTHDSFPKIHMFMGTLWERQNCTSQGLLIRLLPSRQCINYWLRAASRWRFPAWDGEDVWMVSFISIQLQLIKLIPRSTSGHHIKTSMNDFYTLSPDIWSLFWGLFLMSSLESGIRASGCTLWDCFILSLSFALFLLLESTWRRNAFRCWKFASVWEEILDLSLDFLSFILFLTSVGR